MGRSFYSFVLILLVACGDGVGLKLLPERSLVLAFGDSLTFGAGAPFDAGYPVVLEELTGFRVINAGVAGEVTADGLRRLPDCLARHQPKPMVLIHGGNDMLRRMSHRATAANLEAMITLIRDAGAEVATVGVPQPRLILSTAAFYMDVAEKTGIPIEK
ncbi:MAG: acyl-CoA thioesterase-1, partial [Candidatus Azotimanducaceae bacterium]